MFACAYGGHFLKIGARAVVYWVGACLGCDQLGSIHHIHIVPRAALEVVSGAESRLTSEHHLVWYKTQINKF